MTPQQIASRLAELCRQGQFEAAQKELFAEDAVSIEPHETQQFPEGDQGPESDSGKRPPMGIDG